MALFARCADAARWKPQQQASRPTGTAYWLQERLGLLLAIEPNVEEAVTIRPYAFLVLDKAGKRAENSIKSLVNGHILPRFL
jgi:hypothetical protein